jgi:hypothetical protein
VLIRISIESTQPLTGTVARRRSQPRHFDGWLELLSRISELVGAETPVGARDSEAERAAAGRTDDAGTD